MNPRDRKSYDRKSRDRKHVIVNHVIQSCIRRGFAIEENKGEKKNE